jgi:HAD superfamily hydrolase (TIGR01509 family)
MNIDTKTDNVEVLFDYDGTLVTTELIHALAFRRALRDKYGVKLTSEDNCKMLIGKTDREGLTEYLNYLIGLEKAKVINIHVDIVNDEAEILAAKDKYYAELSTKFAKLYPEVADLLARFNANYSMSITSGSSRFEIENTLNKLGISNFFKLIVGGNDVSKSKPDPEPYLETARRLGIDSARCIAIEDSPNGVRSAKAANMRVIAITNTHSIDVLKDVNPDVIVNSFGEINEALIQSLFEE